MSIVGFFAPVERTANIATQFTLTLSSASGANSTPVTLTVTPNGVLGATVNVLLFVSGGGTLGLSGFSFSAGTSSAQSTTLTRSTTGTSTITMSNDGGLGNAGTPASYDSSDITNARISFWGQSNAQGAALRSGIYTSPLSTDSDLGSYDSGALSFSRVKFWNGTAYATLVPGSNNGTDPLIFGPEFGIAVRWMRETTGGTLYLDKNAVGGTSITAFEPGVGARWTAGISAKAAQDAWLSSNSVTIPTSKVFWLWSQGEADYPENQAWYQPRMQTLVDQLIVQGILPGRGILTDIPNGSSRYNPSISAAKQAVATGSSGNIIKLIEPYYMESDNLHLNARGQVQRSYDSYAFFFDASTITT